MDLKSTPQVYIRVFSIKGLPADVIRKYPKGKVSIQSEITQKKSETKPIAFGGKVNLNEVTWPTADGVLKWDISDAELRDIKALQPRIKLNIIMHNETSTQSIPTGFITIDMRDLMGEINQKSFKVNGMNGAEILISAKLNTPINIGPGNMAGVSSESLASVLHLANQEIETEDYDKDEDRFTVSIDLEACRSLYLITLQKREEDKETMKYSSLPTEEERSFWLCWTLFDDEKAFRSEEFSASQQGPRPMRHKITVGCSIKDFLQRLDSAFPLRIFLCTQGDILGAAEIPLYVPNVQTGNYGNFPLKNTGWFVMKPTKQKSEWTGAMESDLPAIQISVKVDCVNRASYEAEYADEFEQDEETPKEIIQKLSAVSESPSSARVTFNIDDIVKDPNEGKTATVETNTDAETSEEEDDDVQPYQNDDEKDTYMRHFRISVEVKSVGGFKRPAHVAVHFAYPHLGASAPVRTHPIWVLPNTESRIDGASASYDCCMSREHLREIFAQHPLKISTMSRSHIGYSAMGEVHIDFTHVMESKSHSYRCPVTGKTFKTLKEYSKHRQIFNALRIAGRVERAPPPEPVVINVVDSYITVMKATEDSKSETSTVGSGSKMRVVVIIEDIGLVGQQMAIPVKPGYKMQNGGLYNVDHDVQYQDNAKSSTETGGLPQDPLQRDDLTDQQRAHLEALRIDWEGWRRAAENQWKEVLREREVELRRRLEAEASASLAQRADDLRRAHEEAGRLEVRLRAAIDSVERQKSQGTLKEEQSQMKLAQKAAELQLLQRRVRDEAKIRIETETRRADSLETQLKTMTDAFHMMEKRAKEAERDFENYRTQSRSSPENVLREEAARLRAQLAEVRTEIERERRLRTETELEKEHFRSQMHRLAMALKREREKNSAMARQELEQLRLEFLAREERYILDGDREELRNIRNELATMRSVTFGGSIAPPPAPSAKHTPSPVLFDDYLNNKNVAMRQAEVTPISVLKKQLSDLMATGRYEESDPVIQELQQSILKQET